MQKIGDVKVTKNLHGVIAMSLVECVEELRYWPVGELVVRESDLKMTFALHLVEASLIDLADEGCFILVKSTFSLCSIHIQGVVAVAEVWMAGINKCP